MKRLIIVRHAKSSWTDITLADIDRPLNERGERDAPRMAKRLKEKNLAIPVMLSSPAVRALTTCRVFARTLQFPENQIRIVKNLYHANEDMILAIVQSIPENVDTVMLFGHNPGLTDFVNALVDADIENIPTTGIVCSKLNIASWDAIDWSCGKVEFFDYPKKG